MMHKCKLLLIFAYYLSVDAACEHRFIHTYRNHPTFSPFGYGPFHNQYRWGCTYSMHRYNPIRITDTQVITCSNASLDTALNYTYEYASNHHLKIVNSTIPVIIANSSLFRLSGFNKMTLNNLEIEAIEIGAFENLGGLDELDLSNNKLMTIPEEILKTLTNLRKLDASSNSISDLTNVNFSNLIHLTHLTLTGNKLKQLHGNMFEGLVRLENMDISNNPLTKFQDVNFKSLIRLIAHNTSLTTFDTDLSNFTLDHVDMSKGNLKLINFDNLPKVRLLEVNNNNLTQIGNLNKLHSERADLTHNFISQLDEIPSNIKKLDLRYNKIIMIKYSKKTFPQSTNSTTAYLNLAFNELSEIEPYVFWKLKRLETLIISNNNLETLHENTVVDCSVLTRVDLSFNKISHIKSNAFKGVPLLTTLDVSHNKLKFLNLEMVPRRTEIRNLYVNNNEITGWDVEMFQDVFINLKWIKINQNPWLCKNLDKILVSFQTRGIQIADDIQSAKIYTTESFSCKNK